MKRLALVSIVAVLSVVVSVQAGVIFEDDFEDGTLSKWTIDGRQEGINIAEVITKDSTKVAHLYHEEFSEITIFKRFDYEPALTFKFDMEVVPYSEASSTSSHYAYGGVQVAFLDSSKTKLGDVLYICSTSSWPFEEWYLGTWSYLFSVPEGAGMVSYNLNAQDVLSNISIDVGSISYVDLAFWAHASSDQYNSYANTWVDNVTVTPEPATILLFGLGSAWILKRKRNGSY
jgi:hypothetical protein